MAYQQPYDPYFCYHPHPLPPQLPDEPGAINTLFVSGLPNDVKAREIHNLFRRRPGFESCQLKYTGRGDRWFAFATFSSNQFAMAAINELNGVKFDPQTGSTLHIELARSNSRRKERNGPYVVIDNRNNKPSKSQDDQSDEGDSDSPKEITDAKSEADSDRDSKAPSANEQMEKATEGGSGARPCSTLFIANLGPNCTEDELKQLFSRYPGFNILKIRARGGMPVAFADFEEMESSRQPLIVFRPRRHAYRICKIEDEETVEDSHNHRASLLK